MKLYTSKQLARIVQLHHKTIERLGREGKIGRVQVGRSVRFYIKENTNGTDDYAREGH